MPSRRETIQTMLSELEWDEGLTMPIANAQNKQLEDELLNAQSKMVSLQNKYKENEDRVNAMTSHLKNVRNELLHTQVLVDARKKEILTEDHMLKLAIGEDGRLRQEIIKVDHGLNNLKEQKNVSENNIFRQMQQLEQMKAQMNWDQQALEAWLEESARKDEDTMTLQKYAREDEGKVKELALKIAHLTDNAQARRRMLDHETMETHTAQIELDKTAEEFRKCHMEREGLITQWEHTIEQMRHRDNEMDYLTATLVSVKDEVRQHEEVIREKQQFYENEIDNNKELEHKIAFSERTAAKLRSDYQGLETERDQFSSEMDALKRTVDRTALDLETTRSTITQIKKDVSDKMTALDRAKDQHEGLVDKLKMVEETTLSAEENAARMDEMMAGEEAAQSALAEEMRRLRDVQFKKTQELHNVRTEEKNCMAEIQGARAAIRNLNSKINVLDNDSLKQQEIIYNEDYQIQQLERRINRMQGEQSNEEKQAMEAKIKQLNEDLEKKISVHDILTLQLKRLQEDIRRIRLVGDNENTEKASLVNKVEEIELHNENSQRELQKTRSNKQALMVDKNVLKLETRRLRRLLYSKADEVLTLEQRKLQMTTAMQERHREIDVHKDMLLGQIKSANEERSQISAELHERISMIDKLRKRYEIQIMSMAPPEGEEERSQAYYVIKAAQEKEELQREGDELDAKIRKAEKEIRALENTLRLMNSRNETYRKSFNNVSDSSDEMDQKLQLEEQLRAVMDKYKYKRRQIRELNDDLQTMSNTLDNLLADESTYVEMIEEKQGQTNNLDKELASQQTKLVRAAKQNVRYIRDVRAVAKAKGPTVDEQDYDLRQKREMNKHAMKQIGDVMKAYPDVAPTVSMYFSQANMTPPPSHYSGSTASSDTSSLHSATSRHSSHVSTARSSARGSTTRGSSAHGSSARSSKSLSLSVQGLEVAGSIGSGHHSSLGSRHSKH